MTEYLPGTSTPVPALMTAEEAAVFLRLDDGRGTKQALRALRRLVDRGLLRPCRVGPSNRYARRELLRVIEELTEIGGQK